MAAQAAAQLLYMEQQRAEVLANASAIVEKKAAEATEAAATEQMKLLEEAKAAAEAAAAEIAVQLEAAKRAEKEAAATAAATVAAATLRKEQRLRWIYHGDAISLYFPAYERYVYDVSAFCRGKVKCESHRTKSAKINELRREELRI